MDEKRSKNTKRKIEEVKSFQKIEKTHKMDELAPMQRMTRGKTRMMKLESKKDFSKVEHFGFDVTSNLREAMNQGGKEANSEVRHRMQGDIKRFILHGKSPDELLNPKFAKYLSRMQKQELSFIQKDNRINPRDGGSYKGHMFTMTRVMDFDKETKPESEFKEIQQPSSPRPKDSGKGTWHRSHTSPYSLNGTETNKAKTVYAPSWSNITIDSGMERFAKETVKKYGEGNVFHFRLDSHDRSSLGVIVHDVKSESEKHRWFTVTAQYKRKNL
ncbi:hypothetical protein [Lysobacter brunescens]|uniref:Uncharacterized protein n=1 Tax=Lysobacter brunescens TaxID=262323 RepID=A0ABW2YBM1_9GAMM